MQYLHSDVQNFGLTFTLLHRYDSVDTDCSFSLLQYDALFVFFELSNFYC